MQLPLPPGGRVMGIGTDLIECERVRGLYTRHAARFLEKVYTPAERTYCLQMRDPVPYLAARFAAKEAVAKCVGTGIGADLGWHSIEVIKGPRGEPGIELDAKGKALIAALGASRIVISLAHTENYGHAVALLLE